MARIVYQSERVTVTRYYADDFGLALDGVEVASYRTQAQAEHAGAMWLHEQTRALVAVLADEAAEMEVAA